jgi:thymidine phosphorylase
VLHKRAGDRVRAGEPLYELRTEDASRIPAALEAARRGVVVADEGTPADRTLIIDRIG